MKNDKVRQYFAYLQIDCTDVWTLFRLLDADGSGEIDLNEFMEGCIKLKGAAQRLDIKALIAENQRVLQKCIDIEAHLSALHPRRRRSLQKAVSSSFDDHY